MKLKHLTILATTILAACSTVSEQCDDKQEVCATVYRNVGGIGDTFYTSVVSQDGEIIAVVGDSQASPAVGILSAGIIGGSIIRGGAAVAEGLLNGVPAIPVIPITTPPIAVP